MALILYTVLEGRFRAETSTASGPGRLRVPRDPSGFTAGSESDRPHWLIGLWMGIVEIVYQSLQYFSGIPMLLS